MITAPAVRPDRLRSTLLVSFCVCHGGRQQTRQHLRGAARLITQFDERLTEHDMQYQSQPAKFRICGKMFTSNVIIKQYYHTVFITHPLR